MHIQRIGPKGKETPVVVVDGVTYDLRPLTSDITPDFLANHSAQQIHDALPTLAPVENAGDMRIGAPLVAPGAIYCIGLNYAKHAEESGALPPENIVVFLKPPHTVAGPDDDIVLAPAMQKVDWEVELAVIIGKEASQLTPADNPLDYVFGYTLSNDLSDRYWQIEVSGGQWSKGKSGAGFLPLGPWIVPASDYDPSDVHLHSSVNEEPRQDSRTSDMIFGIDQIIRDLSQFTVLQPGDIVLTGTPEGVGLSGKFPYLSDGDVVSVSIDGLGSQTNRVVTTA
jgi:2,4-diketo-3-deoxy-L-fuconate hydrolase